MDTVTRIAQVKSYYPCHEQVAFVPTMGYLHEGHMSLVRLARQHANFVVMSIYVNPTQFNSADDLRTYPRNLERDSELAREAGVDLLYVPEDGEIYNCAYDVSKSVRIKAGYLADGLCGQHRHGHFDGVALVVAKLFNIIQPHFAVFGEKDYQQLQVIRQMVADLCFPVEILAAPLIREHDGLALSSRNVRLAPDDRRESLNIYKALSFAKGLYESGEFRASKVLDQVREILGKIQNGNIEYIEIVDAVTLQALEVLDRPCRLIVAVWVGNVRLIDNIAIFDTPK